VTDQHLAPADLLILPELGSTSGTPNQEHDISPALSELI